MSVTLKSNDSAASAAAALGWKSSKSSEPWKPQHSPSSSAAAILAKDYKMAAPWEPVSSSDGAKAALLAARNTKNTEAWKPPATSYGYSAANLAFKSDRNSSQGSQSSRSNNIERQKSLHAARGAMVGRQRAKSTPLVRDSYPDEVNAASNALAAATRAHKPAQSPPLSDEGGAVPFTLMNRQMFTSRPPIKPEVDEQKKSDMLHASAVAMAKKMYTQQQKIIDAKKSQVEAAPARGRRGSLSNVSDDGQPAHITTLQDAAYKQAQKRLAKLHQGNLKTLEYQEYYGAGNLQKRFTIRNKLRRRASSDSAVIDDQTRSQQIRQQMSIFSNKLSEVDDKKRQQDRDALLAVAHRNVQARLKSMDEKISAETGMVPPSTLTQWELKAHTAAQTRSDARVDKNAGKVDVGAGLHLDQDAIDAIAARRVQPLLDEINEKAEEEHAKQLQLKLEMERKKEEEEIEKARQKEIHEINRKLKEQDRQVQKDRRAEEKQEARAKREQEKAVKAEMKRMAKTEKHGASPDLPREDHQEEPTTAAAGQIVVMNTNNQPVSIPRPTTPTTSARHIQDEDDTEPDPASKSSPRGGGKVKTWFKSHFSKPSRSSDEEKPDNNNNGRGFVGGAALTGMDGNDSSTSLGNRSASMRAMALAGRDSQNRERATSSLRGSAVGDNDGGDGDMSSLSSSSDDDDDNDRRRRHRFSDQQPTTGLSPPREVRNFSNQNHSPARDSRFREMM